MSAARITAVAIAAAGLTAATAGAATIVERTPQGYTLSIALQQHGNGRFALTCPSGRTLGRASFRLKGRRFSVLASHHRFRFRGRIDAPGHVIGAGRAACGGYFSEGAIGTARMTSCPPSTPEAPLTSGTPYLFAGVLPNGALGTKLRIEYVNSDGTLSVVHVRTNAAGNFSDSHVFPSDGGTVYGSDAIPRYPDDPLSPGKGCTVEVQ
jgi:hypothetical protein